MQLALKEPSPLKESFSYLKPLFPYGLLITAILAAYADIYVNDFVFDDLHLIAYNQYLKSWDQIGSIFSHTLFAGGGRADPFYRPLQNFLYLIIYQLQGPTPLGFHILDITLHAANTCLVYALGCKIGFRPLGVFFAALIWGLHPIQTEAVTFITGTATPLFTFFCLIGLLVLLPHVTQGRMVLASLCFVLALLSKETAIVFPALATLCLFLVSEQRKDLKIYLRTWPLWLIALTYCLLRAQTLGFGIHDQDRPVGVAWQLYATHFLDRIYTCLATLPTYLGLLAWPTNLHMYHVAYIYADPWFFDVGLGALIVAVAIGQIVWGKAVRGLALSWGIIWGGLAYSPQSGILFPMATTLQENWMYLPSVGLCLGGIQSLIRTIEKFSSVPWNRFFFILASALAVISGTLTYNQNRIWQSALTLYPTILKYNASALIMSNLANAYIMHNELDKASDILHQAMILSDTYPEIHMNLAYIELLRPGWQSHPEKAIAELNRALEIDPNFLPACQQLFNVYMALGNTQQAGVYSARIEDIQKNLK